MTTKAINYSKKPGTKQQDFHQPSHRIWEIHTVPGKTRSPSVALCN